MFVITQDHLDRGITFGGTGYWESPWSLLGNAFITSSFTSRGPPHTGRFHLILWSSGSEARRSVDLSRETNVRLQFWAKADSFEPGDRAEVLVCSLDCEDDSSWTVLKVWEDGEDDNIYRSYDLPIPSDLLAKSFRVRFRGRMSDTIARLFIDDIELVSPKPGPTPTPPATLIPPPPTSTPAPAAKSSPTPTIPAPQTHDVEANDALEFVPDEVTIKVGGTVRWTNVGTVSHTVSFGDQSIPSRGTQNPLASDQTFNVTFSSEGTFNYVCIFHPPNMVGKVIVEP